MPVGAASWSFTEDDFGAITQSLQRFLHDSNARCALLVDRTGQLVATVGEQPNFDPTAFATLTAADVSANDQLAKLIGESDEINCKIVFAADSQVKRMGANQEAMQNLYDVEQIPTGEWVERTTYFEAVAVAGDGVFDTLKAVSKLVLKSLS